MKSFIQELLRKRDRVYILPTRVGGYFNGLIFLMFLLSVGYSNNLLLIFTLILFGLNLLWVIQTHYQLQDLEFERLRVSDGHAGELSSFVLAWRRSPPGLHKWDLRLECDKGKLNMRAIEIDRYCVRGELLWPQRGVCNWRYLYISTERPFGLYRAWRYVKVEGKSFIYPPLNRSILTTPLSELGAQGAIGTGVRGAGDFLELLPYSGTGSHRISWKHYARHGDLLVKIGEDERASMARFQWIPVTDDKKERLLSELATRMVLCHRQNVPFTFEIGPYMRGPEISQKHLARCLEDLSLC